MKRKQETYGVEEESRKGYLQNRRPVWDLLNPNPQTLEFRYGGNDADGELILLQSSNS